MYENKEDEVVCYILMRTDLGMSTGKMVAQGGHAVQYMLYELDSVIEGGGYGSFYDWLREWESSSVKVVLGVNGEELEALISKITSTNHNEYNNYIISKVIDEGRTEIAPNSLTCAGIQPLPRKIAKEFVGHLKLLR